MHILFCVNERVRIGVILRCGIYGLIIVIFAFWTFSMYMDRKEIKTGLCIKENGSPFILRMAIH